MKNTTRIHIKIRNDCSDTNLYLHQINWFHESWLSSELTGVQDTTSCGDNLPSATVNGVCVQCDIMYVKANSTHVLLTKNPLKMNATSSSISFTVTSITLHLFLTTD